MAEKREPIYFRSFGEEFYGFAQAVKVGDAIYIAGQTAMADDGAIIGGDDMAAQMRAAYDAIARVLDAYGAALSDIVDETLYVTDLMAAATVAREVREPFYGPDFAVASSLIGVVALGLPGILIEIKCTARV